MVQWSKGELVSGNFHYETRKTFLIDEGHGTTQACAFLLPMTWTGSHLAFSFLQRDPGDHSVLFSSVMLLWEVVSSSSLKVTKQKLDQHLVGRLLTKVNLSQESLKALGSEDMSVKWREASSSQDSQSLIRARCVASLLTLCRSLLNFVSTFLSPPIPIHFSHEVEQMLG